MATVAGHRILLTGDAELEAQDALLTSGVELHAEVLKVPHHGSAYSDPAFLQSVHAQLALVSVGLNNDYGHPSPLLIAELGRLGVPVRRTDSDGDVAVVVDAGRLVPVIHATRTGNALGPLLRARGPPSGPHATMAECRLPLRLPA
jgi:competence protein ComEC